MNAPAVACPYCAAPLSAGATTCEQCGRSLDADDPATGTNRTREPAPAAPAPVGPVGQAGQAGSMSRTVIGLPIAVPRPSRTAGAAPASADPPVPSTEDRGGFGSRTVMGMPVAPSPNAPLPPPDAGTTSHGAGAPARDPRVSDGRTMLGFSPAASDPPAASPARVEAPRGPSIPGPAHRSGEVPQTQTSDPVPSSVGGISETARQRRNLEIHERPRMPVRSEPAEDTDEISVPGLRRRRHKRGGSGSNVWIWIAFGIVATGGGILLALILSMSGGDSLPYRVTRIAETDLAQVEIDLPAATSGTKVRFRGLDRPVAGGKVAFPIPMDTLSVGSNDFVAEVVAPGGSIDRHAVHIVLSYRVRYDVSGLQANPPHYDIVFEVPRGATVTALGQSQMASSSSTVIYRVPLAQAAGAVETPAGGGPPIHRVAFEVRLPEGTLERGEILTPVPQTALTVEAPAAEAVVAGDTIECAGTVEPGAEVRINDAFVPATAGRFSLRVGLPIVGLNPLRVVAHASGKASRSVERTVRRVRDLAAEMASFRATADRTLNWVRISQNPDQYRGRPIVLRGRVLRPHAAGGVTDMMVLATECPPSMRCPLWVTDRGGSPAVTDGAVVDVFGNVAGTQVYTSARGESRTVPKIEARFVAAAGP